MSSSAAGARATPAAAAGAAEGAGQDAASPSWKSTLTKALIMYVGVQAVTNPASPVAKYIASLTGGGSPQPQPQPQPHASDAVGSSALVGETVAAVQPSAAVNSAPQVKVPTNVAVPVWKDDSKVDIYVYVSSASAPSAQMLRTQQSDLMPESGLANAPQVPFSAFEDLLHDPLHEAKRDQLAPRANGGEELRPMAAVKWANVALTDSAVRRDVDLKLILDEEVRQHNRSIWADFVVTLHGVNPDPSEQSYHPFGVFRSRKLLSRLMPLKKKRIEKNLFDKSDNSTATVDANTTTEAEQDESAVKIVGHWHKNLTLALVQDKGDLGIQLSSLPPPLLQHVNVVRDATSGAMVAAPHPTEPSAAAALEQAYAKGRPVNVLRYPVLFPNDFWLLKEHMHPLNASVTELDLHINLYHQSWFKFQMLAAMGDSFDKQQNGVTGGEIDMIKTMLLETNPWFLALTVIVSVLHSLFEFLAFSSDVKHWRNKDDLAGVSVGSIVTNVVVQLIITLYLLDNNEDTSWMILAGQAVGVLVECWKLTKAVTVGLKRAPAGSWLPYRLDIQDKHKLSDDEKKTQEYDRLAFKYTGIGVGPLLVAYTIYSALYQTHRGWWSFIISTATSFVYAFGFVSLVPQLIVNYKLKSTAGMNSKTFVYKILGTFVDDLFAFCIKMPTLHRLACFRDDVVFFIFLYQRWIYGVDPTRRNEFGQVLDKKHDDQDKDVNEPDHKQANEEVAKAEKAKSSALPESTSQLKNRSKK